MSVNVSNVPMSSGPRTPALDPGTYPTRLVLIVDLGLQKQRPWQGEEKPPARELSLTYEFVDEFMFDEDGQEDTSKPRWLSESFVLYNRDSEKAKSTLRYNTLDPNDVYKGDFLKCIGTPINVTVVQSPNKKNPERPWENVASISTMRTKDKEKCPDLVNKSAVFDLEEPNLEAFLMIPKWLQKRVLENLEFKGSLLERMLEEGAMDSPKEVEVNAEEEETPY
ncbi:MAG: hypothetical protein IH932_01320 [Thaumarchaeota archaeon]|nr:hypothetical protein [Nitrososphaerota archaeon]